MVDACARRSSCLAVSARDLAAVAMQRICRSVPCARPVVAKSFIAFATSVARKARSYSGSVRPLDIGFQGGHEVGVEW
ncbi:hypothetical protein HBF25_20035 [Luteibacter anthropi]|uniref:Uncharacterized protein n=1 Tax=Luteibacter anthropi TaxID=564369 RepID=A0A7X5UE09_9GAMM|nr:hypothetical protein [Luteibacter anthropi]